MPQPISTKHKPAIASLLALLLASLLLAACGSSGASSTAASATNASATTPGSTAALRGRFAAVRACMQKAGITLPKRTPGQTPGGALNGGGPQLPKGMTRAQYEAAVKKCGGFAGGRFRGGASRLASPQFTQALATFATCMRNNGVNVPAPNTSGKGPVFNTKGLNTASAQFKAAESKCSDALRAALPGAGGPPHAAAGSAPSQVG
jgi:hypothetical protein